LLWAKGDRTDSTLHWGGVGEGGADVIQQVRALRAGGEKKRGKKRGGRPREGGGGVTKRGIF